MRKGKTDGAREKWIEGENGWRKGRSAESRGKRMEEGENRRRKGK